MDEIVAQWSRFQALPFPEALAGDEIDGEDLVSLDTSAAGCIATFVGNEGSLGSENRKVLKSCIQGLQKVIPALPPEGKGYFQELLSISLSVEGKLK